MKPQLATEHILSPFAGIELVAFGFGPAELASIGCSASSAASIMSSAQGDTDLLADLDAQYAALSAADQQIRDAERLLRISLTEHSDQIQVLEDARSDRDQAIATIYTLRGTLRGIVCDAAPGLEAFKDRVNATDAVSRRLGAPWRANDNTDDRKQNVAESLIESSNASDRGESTPPDAALVLAQEQAGAHTPLALTNLSQNQASLNATFLGWLTSHE